MSDFILSCESTADLSAEKLAAIDVKHICFHFMLDGCDYRDDLGQSMPFEDFYRAMANGADTKTAAVGTGDYIEYFGSFLEQGKDVLHCSLSSGISSSYEAACEAAAELAPKYPDRKLYVIDSLAASSGYGLLMQTLSDIRAQGKTIDEVRDWAEANKRRLRHWFFSTDLTFYIKGGRVKPLTGHIGNLLNICPLLDVNKDGKLIQRENLRGKKKVVKRIVECMAETAENGLDYAGRVFISQSACQDDAKAVADEAKSFGTKYVVITGMYRFDYGDEATMHDLAARLNKAGAALKAEGVELLYHNHNCELRHVNAEKRAYDILLEETDPQFVNFEFDSYWFTEGGANALAWMQRLGTRMKLWHINDRGTRLTGSAVTPILKTDSMELGTGNMDLDSLMAQALSVGVDAVILESHRNWVDNSPVKSLQVSAEYLKQYT